MRPKRTSSPNELREGGNLRKRSKYSDEPSGSNTNDADSRSSSSREGSSSPSELNDPSTSSDDERRAGHIERVYMQNFMCHSSLEINLNRRINFIVGRNGSGKSAILAAIVIALGCKASTTNRATSIKDFIKNGAYSATVEVTLHNEGLYSYKPHVYGPKIIVVRRIFAGSTPSSYKLKSAKGEVISTKREELERIITSLNIQADNPISVLNQDTARTFLATTDPKSKYTLFMKATKLEDVDHLHARTVNCEITVANRLMLRRESMIHQEIEIKTLEKKALALRKLDEIKLRSENLENEYFWALARDQEILLGDCQSGYDKEKKSLQPLQNTLEKRKEELEGKLQSLRETQQKLKEIDGTLKEVQNRRDGTASEYKDVNTNYRNSLQKYKQFAKEEKKYKLDMQAVRQEIEKHKGGQENIVERKRLTEAIENCKLELNQILAVQQTTEMEYHNLRGEFNHFREQKMSLQAEMKSAEQTIGAKRNQLKQLQSQSDNLTIYGNLMPTLVRRIEECYKQGRFERKPLGPLGSLLKVEDAQWARAIEMELGVVCRYFACHCVKDSKVLQSLFKEVGFPNRGIFVSRFTDQLHNIRDTCVRAPGFRNIFDVINISDVNAANALIDISNIEGILLTPTGKEAADMMSKNVPKNCKKSITLNGDQYFPYPDYRMYAGNRKARATLLQVSKQDIISQLESELEMEQQNMIEIDTRIHELNANVDKNKQMLKEVEMRVVELRSSKGTLNAKVNEYESGLDLLPDPQHFLMLNSELENLQKKIEEVLQKWGEANKESDELKELSKCAGEKVKAIEAEMQEIDESRQTLQLQLTSQKEGVRKTESKIKDCELLYAERCSNVNEELKALRKQEEQTRKVVNHAVSVQPERIHTKRPAQDIQNEITDCKTYRSMVEETNGIEQDILETLDEKRNNYNETMGRMNGIAEGLKTLSSSLKMRKKLYNKIADVMELRVALVFKPLLQTRGYKGDLIFNSKERTLDVQVSPNEETGQRGTKSLSGGERSYSTVSFILSLWECIEPPFYFMDEFDVFMDKVNRTIVINMLLTYAQQTKKHQYVFLTPQETYQITPSEEVTIHKLDDPERITGT